jgi:hypothetical protein
MHTLTNNILYGSKTVSFDLRIGRLVEASKVVMADFGLARKSTPFSNVGAKSSEYMEQPRQSRH